VRIGVSLPNVGVGNDKASLLQVATSAERLGFDSVWAAHHVLMPYQRSSQYPYQRSGTEIAMTPGIQWLDPLITLSMVGGVTDRIGLGTSVFVLPYRDPVTLAAELAALDVLSAGRLILGIGVGWMREEFEAIGVSSRERGARTDEHIQVMKTLWRDDPASFQGDFTRFDGIVLATRPHREGGPPVWVGGNTDAALRRALRFGDGWHGFEVFPEELPDLRQRLETLGDEVGRDPAELELSVARGLIPTGHEQESFIHDRRMLGPSSEAIVEELGQYAEQGLELVLIQISLLAPQVPDALEWVAAEVLPQLT
jgi:probable F420-dependent oxidoreductase